MFLITFVNAAFSHRSYFPLPQFPKELQALTGQKNNL